MYEDAKRPTPEKIKEFCENALSGVCSFLRITQGDEKVCIREAEQANGSQVKPNCSENRPGIKVACKHSAVPLDNQPGALECKDCGKVRKCEHPIRDTNTSNQEYCLLCGMITD